MGASTMTDAPDSKTPGTVPSKPGVMTVLSTVLHPRILQPLDFCDWYEDTHIQEVQTTGGISRTQRYASLRFISQNQLQNNTYVSRPTDNQNCTYDFITVYHMPDLAFRETAAFRGLAGQSVPDEDLVEKIFKQAEFCTRFCEEMDMSYFDSSSTESQASPAKFLVSVGARSAGVPSDYGVSNILANLSEISGRRRTTAYKVHEASVLSAFKRSYTKETTDVVLIEFDSEPDCDAVLEALQHREGLEIGFWGLRRAYEGDERTPAPWKPK